MEKRIINILKILLDIDDIEVIKCVIESLIEELDDRNDDPDNKELNEFSEPD